MRTRLAWWDLVHRRARTAAALGGIAFAVVLIFMQIGFYLACRESAVRIHRLLDFDLLLASPLYVFVLEPGQLPRSRLEQARAVNGVAAAVPLRVSAAQWRHPETGRPRDVVVLGVDPADEVFSAPELQSQLHSLSGSDRVLFDRAAHALVGLNPVGTRSQLADSRELEVAGTYAWGTGFVANATVVTSETAFEEIFGPASQRIELGLLRLSPGADAEAVRQALRQRLPRDVEIWTRAAIESRDRAFYLQQRPVGLMFTSGVVLAFIVGGVILFQVLSSEVSSRRRELATLKALGFTSLALHGVVIEKGMLYAAVAYLPSLLVAAGLFDLTRRLAGLPMELTANVALGVLALTLLMCIAGALAASTRLHTADPADLF